MPRLLVIVIAELVVLAVVMLPNRSFGADHTGEWFFLWGYNRAAYGDSNIYFQGNSYDFTLKDAKADDSPSPFRWKYVFPDVTIPQNVVRIGYYVNKDFRISFGSDHMKYVLRQDQEVVKYGVDHVGNGSNVSAVVITTDYLKYEHTDGLNFISVSPEFLHSLWQNQNGMIEVSAFCGIDAGLAIPKSNVTLGPDNVRHDAYNVAGYGGAFKGGLITDFGESWFMQFGVKTGKLFMPNVRTTNDPSDSASQNITFIESYLAVGYAF